MIPTDPLFAQQWYLLNGSGGLDLNLAGVWDDYTGAGVQVAIIDDGFDLSHADLAVNFRTDIDYDYINFDTVPQPGSGEHHGTAVAGIIGAAAGNGVGGVGVAWDATLVGYRNASNLSLDDAILDAAGLGDGIGNTAGGGNGSDVVNMSFGFAPLFLTDSSFGLILDAMEAAAAQGRNGLGTIFVKSAGNGRDVPGNAFRDEGTAEVMDTSAFTINVGAVRADGWVTDFSTPGANLLVSAFSNDISNATAITTTDRTGSLGFGGGDFIQDFGGTSASAPQVSGVIALMLEANAGLGWRDVQQILALSARHVGSAVGAAANDGAPPGGGYEQATQENGASWFWNGGTQWNGGGLHFSNDYGFGLVDALAAVRLAESWTQQSTSANRTVLARDLLNTTQTIPDGNAAGRSFTALETGTIRVEHAEVELAMTVGFFADLEVYLTSPSGTRVQLVAATGGAGMFAGRWVFGTTALMGEASAGAWTVTVVDAGMGDAITLSDIVLRLAGAAAGEDDLWVFTGEFSEVAGDGAHQTVFAGGSGHDTINASAVGSDVTIDLAAGTGVIDGVAITLSSIEAVLGGDGADILAGTAGAETLVGGRGNDILRGNGGADVLRGGRGDDRLIVAAGLAPASGALFDGGEGRDALVLDAPGQLVPGGAVFDLSGADMLSIEELHFAPGGAAQPRSVIFEGQEFDAPGEFAPQLVVRGEDAAGATERIVIRLGVNQTLDLSGWTFVDWGGQGEAIEIVGDDSDESVVGSSQADTIETGGGNDIVLAGAGNDRIDAGDGRDTVDAGAGDDIVIDGDGLGVLGAADSLDGGDGVDTLIAIAAWTTAATFDLALGSLSSGTGLVQAIRNFENVTVSGSARVIGTNGANTITATEDFASAGNLIEAGGGADTVVAAGGDDEIHGGGGNDRIWAGAGNDRLFGDDGNDTFFADRGHDWIDGGAGNDVIWGGLGNDTMFGDDGDDVLRGNGGADLLDGGAGNDRFFGGPGHDTLLGGADDDMLEGIGGNDLIEGGEGNDTLLSGFGFDRLYGGDGDDWLEGGERDDVLSGGHGADVLHGNAANDHLMGDAGDDELRGGLGDDRLEGGEGNDMLFGQQGDDLMIGGAGDDTLDGGLGVDRFLFTSDLDGNDRINRFEVGIDLVHFSGITGVSGFSDLVIIKQDFGSLVVAGAVTVFIAGVTPGLLDADDFVFG
ncbi:S8 family serine peptidase [Limibaculum sp. FT325]|uniref:S8 family serine peptidase n=1 Tax=Thermohalobaculum sediminis TaxID=2939436 RepID=UPI0020C0D166|nr:S8 family serine peptidase [Limibaculum sediminis]MCL5777231.1 S8 family serine peptidase [Limibaculum sediminis]